MSQTHLSTQPGYDLRDDEVLTDRELLEEVVRALVAKPALVTVEETIVHGATYLKVVTDPTDTGKIIGKQGRTADAIRLIFQSVASLTGRKVYIEIYEPNKKIFSRIPNQST